jgi:hypothetical protein
MLIGLWPCPCAEVSHRMGGEYAETEVNRLRDTVTRLVHWVIPEGFPPQFEGPSGANT